jgi:hypothetical protein
MGERKIGLPVKPEYQSGYMTLRSTGRSPLSVGISFMSGGSCVEGSRGVVVRPGSLGCEGVSL